MANLPDITESEFFDTFHLLIDSMDFSEENRDDWLFLIHLCVKALELHWGKALVRIMRLLSFELKMNTVKSDFFFMLCCVSLLRPAPERD